MAKTPEINDVLDFWFDEIDPVFWFKKDTDFDAELTARFSTSLAMAMGGRLDKWADNSDGCLALILLLDQFTRTIFRDQARAFSGDDMALALSLRCIERGYIDHPDMAHRQFMLMPMMHSEDLTIQEKSLPLFKAHTSDGVYDFAVKHRDVIAQFDRFPHRNIILSRPSTDAELSFLTKPGSSF